MRILVLAQVSGSSNTLAVQNALDGHGIPYDVVEVSNQPNSAITLESGANRGRYSAIIFADGEYVSTTLSATSQQTIREYQQKYGVRSMRINIYPYNLAAGITPLNPDRNFVGCCLDITDARMKVRLSELAKGLKTGIRDDLVLSIPGLFHFPATIIRPEIAEPFLIFDANPPQFVNASSAATVVHFGADGVGPVYDDLMFHFPLGTWSIPSLVMNHLWLGWLTKGVYAGERRLFLNVQVDDLFLSTNQFDPVTKDLFPDASYRSTAADLKMHAAWTKFVSAILPAGSNFTIEMAFNGNGILLEADEFNAVYNVELPDTSDPYTTPGVPSMTGESLWRRWRVSPSTSGWSSAVFSKDALYDVVRNGRGADDVADAFFWLSHTFTHLNLNHSSAIDTDYEVKWNQYMSAPAFLNLDSRITFSKDAMVTPKISGLFNGVALKMLRDNGITSIVGDNSRLNLINPISIHLPYITTKAINGFDGMMVLPRHPTDVYYCSDTSESLVAQYNSIYNTNHDIKYIMNVGADRALRNFLSLDRSSYMFHQPNLRVANLDVTKETHSINGRNATLSLLQYWTEAVVELYSKYATWPIRSARQSDMAAHYRARFALHECKPETTMHMLGSGAVSHFSVASSTGLACAPPVTIPKSASFAIGSSSSVKIDSVGNEPDVAKVAVAGKAPVNVTVAGLRWYVPVGYVEPSPSPSPSTTPSPSPSPSMTPSPSPTPSPSTTPSPSPTPSPSSEPSPTPSPSSEPSPSPSPSASASPIPSVEPTPEPTPEPVLPSPSSSPTVVELSPSPSSSPAAVEVSPSPSSSPAVIEISPSPSSSPAVIEISPSPSSSPAVIEISPSPSSSPSPSASTSASPVPSSSPVPSPNSVVEPTPEATPEPAASPSASAVAPSPSASTVPPSPSASAVPPSPSASAIPPSPSASPIVAVEASQSPAPSPSAVAAASPSTVPSTPSPVAPAISPKPSSGLPDPIPSKEVLVRSSATVARGASPVQAVVALLIATAVASGFAF